MDIAVNILWIALVLFTVWWVLASVRMRRRASLEDDATGPTSSIELAKLAESLQKGMHWRRALTDLPPILERAIEESAARQDRDVAGIAHDVIRLVPFALKHNLYELDELAAHQLLGPWKVVWNLSDVPLDVVPLKQCGWYENARVFLNTGAEIVYFQSTSRWVNALRSMLLADQRLNPDVILDQSQERCQLWEVLCPDALGLLLPEMVIWDPGEKNMHAQINSGDSIRVEQSETGFTFAPDIKLCVREADSKLLSQRYERALELYSAFIEKRRVSGLPIPLGVQELRKQLPGKAELEDAVSPDPERVKALIDEAKAPLGLRIAK